MTDEVMKSNSLL